jgi:calcineurin-like phosphoesterase family protein
MTMGNLFFTADTHFFHANIIRYSKRPFQNVEEMNEEIIRRWNMVVGKNDTVYHLGDFAMTDGIKRNEIRDCLNGKIFFIPGSHDKDPHGPNWTVLKPMETIKLPIADEITNQNIRLTMCHYSMRSWPLSHYGSWAIYGHHHGALEPYGMSFDIGVDCWDFYPVSLDDISKKMATLKPIVDFRKPKYI